MVAVSFHPEDLLSMGVNPVYVLLLLALVVLIPVVIVKFILSKKPRKCTECGEVFKPTFLKTPIGISNDKGRDMPCPRCKKITYCQYIDSDK